MMVATEAQNRNHIVIGMYMQTVSRAMQITDSMFQVDGRILQKE
jgi:hypothetical protein